MADTQTRIDLTTSAWVSVTAGPINIGTITPENIGIRLSITTGSAPTDLTQGHPLNPKNPWTFQLDTGETLYAIADGEACTAIATY